MCDRTRFLKILLLGPFLLIGWVGWGKSFAAETSLTRTQSGGGVTIEVTYLNPQEGEDARFQIAMNTHSVNLDSFDPKTASVLQDETGKEYRPTKVENKGSGHHRELIVTFPKPDGKKLELLVRNVAGIKQQSFRWELQ